MDWRQDSWYQIKGINLLEVTWHHLWNEFIHAVDSKLLEDEIDIAVHSVKMFPYIL